MQKWDVPAIAEGIVLIDEIGAHLHPRWKMEIVKSLRETFPSVQFVCTTHEPLCLRGLEDDEVVVMRRNTKNRVVQLRNLPSVKALRIDQLLTSEHFGLDSTYDTESAKLMEEYYRLLVSENADKKRIQELRKNMSQIGLMGQNRRERLMLTAIDRYLTKEAKELGDDQLDNQKLALDRELDNILQGDGGES